MEILRGHEMSNGSYRFIPGERPLLFALFAIASLVNAMESSLATVRRQSLGREDIVGADGGAAKGRRAEAEEG
jgi:hypothetical protein